MGTQDLRRFLHVLVIVSSISLALAAPAAAQTVSATTGALNGRVTDNTGAVLPGVTVTISSPSLMGTRTTVTTEEGQYRFPAIPPGVYQITYELAGFNSVKREEIRVTLGFTATVNVELGVASLQESVTVTGESPVVDTSATSISTNFDARQLANMPSARDLWAILAESPGIQMNRIDVGGSAAGTQTGYVVYGTTGQNRPTVEGIVATEGTGAAGFYYDYGSFDEVAVNTAAHSAEMPWPGVQSNFISKSGGNAFHGSVYADYENENIQSRNTDEDQVRRGLQGGGGLEPSDLNRLQKYYDVNVGMGGFVKRDRLWWYGSFRDQYVAARIPNFPVKPHPTRLTNYTGKGTYNLTENNKLIAYAQAGRKHQPLRQDSFLLGNTTGINLREDSTWEQLYWGWVWKGEWNSVVNDATFVEIRGGQFGYNWPNLPNGSEPRFEDTGNSFILGGNRDWQRDRRRNQVLGSLSYFKDGWGGNHNFKFGGEIFRETTVDMWKDGYPNNVLHRLNNGAPTDVYLFEPGTGEVGLWTYAGFANDTWRVNNRLTLNVGIRLDKYVGFLPEQEHPVSRFNPVAIRFDPVDEVINWNLVSPRAGLTFDVMGNGKTVLKLNYGQYWWNPGADFMFNVSPNANGGWNKRYSWTDPNRNGRWDPGEEGRLVSTSGGVATESLDPNLEDTFTRELAGWFERELFANFGMRTGFIWRGVRQPFERINANQPFSAFSVPVSIPDPGPDNIRGNADDGPPIQGFNLSPEFAALTPRNVQTNVPDSDSDFYTWEITGTKRFSRRWSLLASFAHTWVREFENAYFGNTVRQYDLRVTPNDLINTNDGRHEFTTWQGKLHGTWETPWWDVRLTPILRHQSGQPWGRFFQFAFNYGTQRVLAEPLGTRRQDNITLLDVRIEKVVRFGSGVEGSRSISAFIDVFNMFNANAEQNITWSSGTSFLRPSNIVPPRILRFGTKFEW
jgi:hypothetical protein